MLHGHSGPSHHLRTNHDCEQHPRTPTWRGHGLLPGSGLIRMSTTSHTYMPRDAHQPRGRRPWCAECDTDRHLLVDSVTSLNAQQQTLAAAITCAKCRGSRVLATTAAFLAEVPGRNWDNNDLVHRDAGYVHCQEPMSPADPGLRGVQWPVSTQAGSVEFPGVYLRTRVLRCRCGFQTEVPNETQTAASSARHSTKNKERS